MNNICIDLLAERVTVEGQYGDDAKGAQPYKFSDGPEALELLIRKVLDTASYGGESVCLEVRGNDGLYNRPSERWSFWS